MTPCKSPTHDRYRTAVESLYIHARLAEVDLNRLLENVRVEARDGKTTEGFVLVSQQHRLDDVEQRLAFGREQLADANVELDRHFTRGCRNVTEAVAR